MLKMVNEGKSTSDHPHVPLEPVEPIFASTHAALKFAFNFSHGMVKKNFLAQVQGGGGNGRGLAGLDGAAQAGMILCELDQLTAVRRECITGKLAPQTEPCSCRSRCCRGVVENRTWAAAVEYLTEYVLLERLTGSISHQRLRRSVVMKYLGVKVHLVEIAQLCGVHRDTASDLNKRVVTQLRDEERIGMHEIDGRLKGAGIVSA